MSNTEDTEPQDELDNEDIFGDFDEQPTIRGLRVGDTVLGRFELKKCLGRGGMGEVWLAGDETLDEEIALKLLPRMIHFDDQAVEDLKNESKRGRQLSHPNIVRVFDFYQDDNNTGISMEYVKGDNLAALRAKAKNKVFSVDEIYKWVTEFLQGLEYAHHGEEVVHRDIKPSNVMIESKSGRLKIADFGIARCLADSMERVTVSAQNRGTLCYMSPEQANGRGVNHLDDIYAVGATLYEMLAGSPPFYTGDIYSQIMKVPPMPIVDRQREKNFLQPPPPIWEGAIMKCLEKERANRPAGAGVLLEMLNLGKSSYEIKSKPDRPGKGPAAKVGIESTDEVPDSVDNGTGSVSGLTGGVTFSTSADLQTVPSNETQVTFDLTRTAGDEMREAEKAASTKASDKPTKLLTLPVILSSLALILVATLLALQFWPGKSDTDITDRNPNRVPYVPDDVNNGNGSNSGPLPIPPGNEPQPYVPPAPPEDVSVNLLKEKFWKVPGHFDTIQEAIDAYKPGKIIQLESRTYAESIVLKSGVTIQGSGVLNTTIKADGLETEVVIAANAEGIELKGIKFEHRGDQFLAGGKPVGSFTNCDAINISNCVFHKGIEHGLFVSGKGEITITDCDFTENSDSGLWCESGASLKLKGCKFMKNTSGLTVRDIMSQATIEESKFENNVIYGIEVSDQGRLVMSKKCQTNGNKRAGIFAENQGTTLLLTDVLVNSGKFGIIADDGVISTISSCNFSGTDCAIALNNPGATTIKDCTIADSKLDGIVLEAPLVSGLVEVAHNQITNCGNYGLVVNGKNAKPLITDNRLGPNGQADFLISNAGGGSFARNRFRSETAGATEDANNTKATIDDTNVYEPSVTD